MKKTTLPTTREENKEMPANEPQPTPQVKQTNEAKESPEDEKTSKTIEPPEPGQPQEPTQAPAPGAPSTDDFEARIAEAETRGYLRGRNERIAELMREPAIFERQAAPAGRSSRDEDWQGESQPMILNNPRVSIWDK